MAFILTIREASFRYKLALLSLLVIIIGMFMSRAMMSIGMILIGLQFFLKKNLMESFRNFWKDRMIFLFVPLFFMYFLTGILSNNHAEFWARLSIKLPLLFMPMGFSALKNMPKKYYMHVLYCFLLLSAVTAAISVWIFISNYHEITENYKYAKVLPNVFNINHIRFSLMLVMAIFSSWYLYKENYFLLYKTERFFILSLGVFLVLFIHLLSVRSGLLAFYSCCFVMAISAMFIYKKYVLGGVAILLILITPVIAYVAIPTVKNKVEYMVIDVSRFFKGEEVSHWSDGNRLLSIKIGLELGNSKPILGVGIGDLADDMAASYKNNYPTMEEKFYLIPHNEFVYVYAACGMVGLLVFCITMGYPFFQSVTYKSIVFLALVMSLFTSFLSEATLENQLGVCLFITFYLIGWQCRYESKSVDI